MFNPASLTAKVKTCITHYAVITVMLLACSSNALAQDQTRGQSGNSRDQGAADGAMHGWPAYGGAPGGGQYSPLSRIDRENVEELEVAWIYHSGDVSDGAGGTAVTPLEVNPILANDRLYPVHAVQPHRGAGPGNGGRGVEP